ncbi:AAA family ATPase [Croceiramulus getboli]|nr:AAA family ATPase [Flavobacteriaceae bacterium YJPT1-3]
MIEKLELKNFKRWKNKSFGLKVEGVTVIAGGNNSGKSSLLHAFAVWEFCKTYILFEKGKKALYTGYNGQGVGINYNDFSPVNIPNLKYLWTNLKPSGGYNLKIKLHWSHDGQPKFLEFGLALANERLFIKSTKSNVEENTVLPNIAYLPPFAGITENEAYFSPADRRKMIGRGLAGAILRNTIIDMHKEYQRKRDEAKGDRAKIPTNALRLIKETDPFFVLNKVLNESFGNWLYAENFNPVYHSYIKIQTAKGNFDGSVFKKFNGYSKRDIMVEGSGFLQWLSVFTFALDPHINVLLLDEPDAHLHSSLQSNLINKLEEICDRNQKQIMVASHSTEIISNIQANAVLEINKKKQKYLTDDRQKINLISGLGSEYSPLINNLQKSKKLLFVENKSDSNILENICNQLGKEWPKDLVIWPMSAGHDSRKQLYLSLKDEIKGLRAISLIDRDREEINTTNRVLRDKNIKDFEQNEVTFLRYRKWRRRHIESYLICPSAIARISKCKEEEIRKLIQEKHSIVIPDNYTQSDHSPALDPIFHCDGKEIIETITNEFGVNKFDISKTLLHPEICIDLKTFVEEIITTFTD